MMDESSNSGLVLPPKLRYIKVTPPTILNNSIIDSTSLRLCNRVETPTPLYPLKQTYVAETSFTEHVCVEI